MKKILIYCCTGNEMHVTCLLDDEKYEIIGYSDSNSETWGKIVWGDDGTKRELITNYGVKEEQVIVFQPNEKGVLWKDERIAMLRTCATMLKVRNILGSMAGVGVYKGEFAKFLNRYFPEKKLYLFDTFEGFDSERDKVNACDLNNFMDTSVDIVLNKMLTPEKCIVKKGYFPDTAVGIDDIFYLVSLDTDLYNPILAGLQYFYPRLEKGGYIFIHDFGSYHYEGVKDAVYKYCNEKGAAVVPLMDRRLSVIVAK